MIASSVIKDISNKLQTTEQNVRREYLQNLFLSYFYAHPESDKIYFKGGTALRIINRSPRFSEDLDFSTTVRSMSVIENIIILSVKEIEREGVNIEIVESKKTSGGHLAIIQCNLQGHQITLQLEISQRRGNYKSEVVTIVSEFTTPYILVALDQDQLVTEKIQALISRQKPRDYYDLYFILKANLLPVKEKSILTEVLPLLKKTNIQFEQELKIFLPKSHWPVIRNFKQTLEREVQRTLGV